MRHQILTVLPGYLLCAAAAVADDTASAPSGKVVDFVRDVQPIFQEHCSECHGLEAREGGLRLTSPEDLLLRNDSGVPAIVAGNSSASELIRRVTAAEDERMPPEEDPLTDEQVRILRDWIDSGADWPSADGIAGATHWAYVPPTRPALPNVDRTGWLRNPIDAFILETLERAEPPLAPSQSAEAGKLLRRLYLDLIGLPPSPAELDAFIADPGPNRYEEIVDRLLASPQYGEKWARHWLDLARYADSNGYQADQFREMWAYRDWVIQAMNDDMPFDRFTIEQIAGDLLPDATLAQRIATGFHRCTTCNVEAGVDPEENRVNQIVDRVNTTGTVWLGTSLECAQCHNHKYDPFTQQDYYQLLAFFNNTPLEVERPGGTGVQFEVAGPKMELPLSPPDQEQRDHLLRRKQDLQAQIRQRRDELTIARETWEAQLRDSLATSPEWHVLTDAQFESSGGQTVDPQEDGSLLISGANPGKDTYRASFETDLAGITGFKLECLTHESLPGNGPGRGSAERPNFVLYEFEVSAQPRTARGSRAPTVEDVSNTVRLHSPSADFSQNNWDVAGLIDGDPETGWAINPRFGQDHWATFLTTEPIDHAGGCILSFTLPQHYGGARTIGRLRISAMTGDPGVESIPDDVREVLAVASDQRNEQQSNRLAEFHEQQDPVIARLRRQMQDVDGQLQQIRPDTTLVMVELDEPRMTNIMMRGDFLQPGAEVLPATPSVLHPLRSADSEDADPDRLALARWLVAEENPLVARVTVNRWWAEIFGRGLVNTIEDFGSQGDPPTHPELLDWLAVEFMDSGWSMKHMHKLIVMSATYQQDSRVSPNLLQRDPFNELYARGPRLRLPAELIRDNALAVSGLLSLESGGPPVYPPQPNNIWRHVGRNAPKYDTDTDQDRYRRGIFVVWRRSAPYPSFVSFDAPDRASCVVNRSRTNTPLQALTLLNDPAYVEMGLALARRMAADDPELTDRQRIEYGFRLCTARTPATQEANHLLHFFQSEFERYQDDTRAANQLIPASERLETVPTPRLAAWFSIANVLLNLDETVTKE